MEFRPMLFVASRATMRQIKLAQAWTAGHVCAYQHTQEWVLPEMNGRIFFLPSRGRGQWSPPPMENYSGVMVEAAVGSNIIPPISKMARWRGLPVIIDAHQPSFTARQYSAMLKHADAIVASSLLHHEPHQAAAEAGKPCFYVPNANPAWLRALAAEHPAFEPRIGGVAYCGGLDTTIEWRDYRSAWRALGETVFCYLGNQLSADECNAVAEACGALVANVAAMPYLTMLRHVKRHDRLWAGSHGPVMPQCMRHALFDAELAGLDAVNTGMPAQEEYVRTCGGVPGPPMEAYLETVYKFAEGMAK